MLHRSVGYRTTPNSDTILELMEKVSHNGEHILSPASTPWIDFLPIREYYRCYDVVSPNSEYKILGQFLPQWISACGTNVPVFQYRRDIETALEWLQDQIQRDLVSLLLGTLVFQEANKCPGFT